MTINAYLYFDGSCEEAFQLYAKVFGAQPGPAFRFGQSPMAGQFGPNWAQKIMHISMEAGGQTLMGSDAPPPHFQPPQGFAVNITPDSVEAAERIYHELSQGGKIGTALQETFWAKRYAQFVDRFGTPWMINVVKPM